MKGVNGYRKEKQRLFCQGHSGKKRFFKKVLKEWEEEGIGTNEPKFIITIKKGFSFLENKHLSTMTFDTVNKAMDEIHKIYTCNCDSCNSKKVNYYEKEQI